LAKGASQIAGRVWIDGRKSVFAPDFPRLHISRAQARRIAANIAKPPELLGKPQA
jgi:hypothetical protein